MSDKLQFVDAAKVTDEFIGRLATDKALVRFLVGAFFGASNVAFFSLITLQAPHG